MSETLKFGFIGCGGMGRHHASNTKKIEGMEVIGWCDVRKDRADDFLNTFGGKYATENAQDIFDDDEVDAVMIQTGEFYHPKLGIGAAKAGKHMFIEKPVARTLEEADQLVEAVKEAGVKFQLGFCFEYSPTIERAKQIMPNSSYSVCQCAATLVAQACHNIDIIVHKIHKAPLVSVYASGGKYFNFDQHLPIDSFAAVFFLFDA